MLYIYTLGCANPPRMLARNHQDELLHFWSDREGRKDSNPKPSIPHGFRYGVTVSAVSHPNFLWIFQVPDVKGSSSI